MSENTRSSNDVIGAYLDELLSDGPTLMEEKEASHQESLKRSSDSDKSKQRLFHLDDHPQRRSNSEQIKLEKAKKLLSQLQEKDVETKPVLTQPVLKTPTIKPEVIEPEVVVEEKVEVETTLETDTEVSDAGTPSATAIEEQKWAQEPFQTLLFKSSGLTLAVPLVKLGGIHRMDQEVTSLFGKPDWFMGLMPSHNGNINVIDTSRWVMPEKYAEAKTQGLNYEFIILLDESQWGLACSHVQNAITISPDQVKWRQPDSKRPWLAGMLVDEMCALLDVDTLIQMLNDNYPR